MAAGDSLLGFEVVMAKLPLKALAAQNITPLLQRRAISLLVCKPMSVCLYARVCGCAK